jgi:hypothetical protein
MKKLVLVAALAACGSPPAEVIDGYSVSTSSISFNHSVGQTECPQDLGDVEVANESDANLIITASAEDVSGEDLLDFGDADDQSPTSPDTLEFELLPGESFIFVPWFNCGQPFSFNTNIVLTPEDLEVDEAIIQVTADVQ